MCVQMCLGMSALISTILTNPARSPHRASSASLPSLNTREVQPHIKADKSSDRTIVPQMCTYLSWLPTTEPRRSGILHTVKLMTERERGGRREAKLKIDYRVRTKFTALAISVSCKACRLSL